MPDKLSVGFGALDHPEESIPLSGYGNGFSCMSANVLSDLTPSALPAQMMTTTPSCYMKLT